LVGLGGAKYEWCLSRFFVEGMCILKIPLGFIPMVNGNLWCFFSKKGMAKKTNYKLELPCLGGKGSKQKTSL